MIIIMGLLHVVSISCSHTESIHVYVAISKLYFPCFRFGKYKNRFHQFYVSSNITFNAWAETWRRVFTDQIFSKDLFKENISILGLKPTIFDDLFWHHLIYNKYHSFLDDKHLFHITKISVFFCSYFRTFPITILHQILEGTDAWAVPISHFGGPSPQPPYVSAHGSMDRVGLGL